MVIYNEKYRNITKTWKNSIYLNSCKSAKYEEGFKTWSNVDPLWTTYIARLMDNGHIYYNTISYNLQTSLLFSPEHWSGELNTGKLNIDNHAQNSLPSSGARL